MSESQLVSESQQVRDELDGLRRILRERKKEVWLSVSPPTRSPLRGWGLGLRVQTGHSAAGTGSAARILIRVRAPTTHPSTPPNAPFPSSPPARLGRETR
jgi:hypothetical protein